MKLTSQRRKTATKVTSKTTKKSGTQLSKMKRTLVKSQKSKSGRKVVKSSQTSSKHPRLTRKKAISSNVKASKPLKARKTGSREVADCDAATTVPSAKVDAAKARKRNVAVKKRVATGSAKKSRVVTSRGRTVRTVNR
ncbi:hypothetical protein GJ496_009806 [Pomphorhynchus laevis]|nr:hypothetical protein GJ496_009806 [Pomphorhynchus laevis]